MQNITVNIEERAQGWTMVHGNMSTFSEGSNLIRESVCADIHKQLVRHEKASCIVGSKPDCKTCIIGQRVLFPNKD